MAMTRIYTIDPVPKPRQTRADKWKKRPAVMRYRAFADHVRALRIQIPETGAHVVFHLPMPKSWSAKKREAMRGKPHQQKPDWDNLAKALQDAVCKDDSGVWRMSVEKRWAENGKIEIRYQWEAA